MKLLLFISLIIPLALISQQGIFIKGANIISPNGDTFHVNGALQNDSAVTLKGRFLNTGTIYLTGDIQNNTNDKLFWNDSSGVVVFNGAAQQSITGDSVNFYTFKLDNGSGVLLNASMSLQDTLSLINGTVDLNGNTLKISEAIGNGVVVGENNSSYIFGNGQIRTERVTNAGGDIGGIGLVLPVNTLGNSTIHRFHQSIANAGDGSIERYYTIEPNNIDTVVTEIRYLDHELNGLNESDLDIFHSSDSTWWKRQFGTPNFASNWVANASVIYPNQSNWLTISEYYCDTPPAITFTDDTAYRCGTDSVLLQTNLPSILEYKWSSGQQDSSIYATTAGTYIVEVWSSEGCYSTDSVVVMDKGIPDAAFSVPVMTCLGDQSELHYLDTVGLVPVVQYEWILGDLGNTSITTTVDSLLFTYPSGGSFVAELIVHSDFGCTDTTQKTILVDSLPYIDFSFADVCLGESATLISNSQNTGISSSIIQDFWDFGDGNTQSGVNPLSPSHTFATAGTYPIKLVSTENTGCKDSLTSTITVHPNPVSGFTASQVCEGLATSFTNTSTGASTYQWSFESPNQSTVINPSYVFSGDGTYNVKLIATSAFGCDDTTNSSVAVNVVPQVAIAIVDTCMQSEVQFESTVSDTILGTSYSWTFGDGNTSNQIEPSHEYLTDGGFTVDLSVTSGNGCMNNASTGATIHPTPIAAFSYTDDCTDSLVQFTDGSMISSGSIIAFEWDFDDGNMATLQDPLNSFSVDGAYGVELVVESNQGCTDTLVQSISIHPNSTVNLGGNLTTCGSTLTLDAGNVGATFNWSTTENSQTILVSSDGAYWVEVTNAFGCSDIDTANVLLNIQSTPNLGPDADFCDSALLDAYSPGATYTWSDLSTDSVLLVNASGTYYVDRIDQNGCLGTDTIIVTINTSPTVDLGVDQTFCEGNSTLLDAGNVGLDIAWSNGDVGGTLQTDTTGFYVVTVTNLSTGCFDTDDIQVTVNPNPIVSLGNDTTVCDSINLSVGTFSAYTWFDGGITQSNTIFNSGWVWLDVQNSFGCTTRDSIQIVINETPTVDLGQDQTLCIGANVILDGGTANSFLWSTSEISSSILVQSAGTYYVDVSNGNCMATDTIIIAQDSIWQIDLGNDTGLCVGNLVELAPNYLTDLTFEWYQDGNAYASSNTISTSASGEYVVQATNGVGCISSDTVIVIIYNLPVVAEFLMPTNVYVGDTVNFVGVSLDSSLSYLWSFGDNTYSTNDNPQHTYFVPGTYDVICEVSNGYCYDSLMKEINVGVKHEIWFDYVEANLNATIQDAVLYPNPSDQITYLGVLLSEKSDVTITIYDLSGRQIQMISRTLEKQSTTELDISSIESGVYLVNVSSGLEVISKRLIKQ